MFGTLLTWLSTKTCPVFFIMTCNRIDILPPELIRKGRIDDVFWFDLPTVEERRAIFGSLLKHRYKIDDLKQENVDNFVDRTEAWTGAEIDSLIQDGLYALLEAGSLDFSTSAGKQVFYKKIDDVLDSTKPQAEQDAESMGKIRSRASGFRKATAAPAPLKEKLDVGGIRSVAI